MLAHKRATLVLLGECIFFREPQTQRRNVRALRVIGHNRFRDEIRPLRLHPTVYVLSIITVRPPVESSVPHGSQEVRNLVGADLVPLVGDSPMLVGLGLPAKTKQKTKA